MSRTIAIKVGRSPADRIFDIAVAAFLVLCALLVLYPLVFILSASLSSTTAVVTGRVWLLPVEPTLESYRAVFSNKQVFSGYYNSAVYVALGVSISVMLTLCAAYPLSRRKLVGRKAFTALFLFTMLFSGGLIPTYLVVKSLGMINTRWAIVLPNALGIWNLIVTRTYIRATIPEELYEVAEMEGGGDVWLFFKVVVPLSGPIVAVMALYYAVGLWNGYFDSLLYLSDPALYPLQLILRNILILNQIDINMIKDVSALARMQGMADVLKYALIVVATAPFLAVYPFVQKHFVKGMLVGSVKG